MVNISNYYIVLAAIVNYYNVIFICNIYVDWVLKLRTI
jgi:hypothetical protein